MQTRNIPIWAFGKLLWAMGVVFSLIFSYSAAAELWKFQPTVSLEGRYDDNLRLTTQPHEAVNATILRGVLAFSRLTETGGIIGRIHADASNYSGDDEIKSSSNNLLFTANANHKGERSKMGVDFSYKRDTTIRNLNPNIGEDIDENIVIDPDLDVGLVEVDIKRDSIKVRPTMYFQLNERTGLNLSYQLSDIQYKDNLLGSGLFDYDRQELRVGLSRQLTERDLISFNVAGARYEAPDNNDNKVDSYETTVGYKRLISEKTNGEILVGLNQSEQSSLLSSSKDNGFVLRGKLEHITEQTNYLLRGSHDLQPSGGGSVREINQVDFKVKHSFSSRLNGIFNLRAQQRNTIENNSKERQHFLSLEPGLRWKLTRWWNLGTGYRYRKSKRSTNKDAADSNSVYVSIGYSKPYTSN